MPQAGTCPIRVRPLPETTHVLPCEGEIHRIEGPGKTRQATQRRPQRRRLRGGQALSHGKDREAAALPRAELEAIWCVHKDEFPVCVRTFYNYMGRGIVGLASMELPRKVRYAPRKKRREDSPKMSLEGRTYADWPELPEEMRLRTVQVDCVEGLRRNSKAMLSLHFVRLFLQIHVLLESKTQACVKGALDALEEYCEGAFADVFPVILGDRGSEFLDFGKIETGMDGARRTSMFYCDPVKPGQKGAAEKNHVELRKILPKGTDFDALAFADVSLACSHANSYVRPGQGAAPIALASLALPRNLLESLGIEAVPPDDVIMKPSLLGL